MTREFQIAVSQCEETGVLIAGSDDLPGLVLEAPDIAGLVDALLDCAPYLIRENLGIPVEGCRLSLVPAVPPVRPASRRQQGQWFGLPGLVTDSTPKKGSASIDDGMVVGLPGLWRPSSGSVSSVSLVMADPDLAPKAVRA